MNPDKLALLHTETAALGQAAYLETSWLRSASLIGRLELSDEELAGLASLSSRFARLADLLIQRLMRLIDELELESVGSILDRIQRAEKRGWVAQTGQLIRIRELRSLIAHEYAAEKMAEIYAGVARLAPTLLAVVAKVRAYADQLAKRLGG